MWQQIKSNLVWCRKTSHIFFSLIILFTFIIMASATARAFQMVNKPFAGFGFLDIGDGYIFVNSINQKHWSGMQHGLRFQDVIRGVEGQPASNYRVIRDKVAAVPVGTPLTYTGIAWKDGNVFRLQIPTSRFTWSDFWLVFGLPFLSAFVLMDMAIVVYLLRPLANGTWAFVMFTLSLCLYIVMGFDASFHHEYVWIFWLVGGLLPAAIIHLTARFPEDSQFCRQHLWFIPVVYAGAVVLSLSTGLLRDSQPIIIRQMLLFSLVVMAIAGVFFFANMIRLYLAYGRSYQHTQNVTIIKLRVKVLLIGAVLAYAVPGVLALLTVVFEDFYIPFNYFGPLLLIFPIAAAYSMVQYNLFGVDNYIKRAIVMLFFTGTTIALYFLIVVACEQMGHPEWRQSPLFTISFTILTVLLFTPFRHFMQGVVEQWLSRNKKTYRQFIQELSQKLTMVLTRQEIVALLVHLLIEELGIRSMTLWVKGDTDCSKRYVQDAKASASLCLLMAPAEIEHLLGQLELKQEPVFIAKIRESNQYSEEERSQYLQAFEQLQATLLLPLVFRQELIGTLILGEKSNAQPYTSEDLEMLQPLSYQIAVALENAKYYETIRELNDNLEKKVEERTQQLRRTIEEKEAARAHLIRSESLAAIGQLVAGVAHELNNPLGSAHSLVQSVVEILEEKEGRDDEEEEVLDDLKFVLKEQSRARDIVSSLLDLSRQTQSYEEPVALNQVIDDAIRILHNKYKYNNIRIEKNYDETLPTIYGNFSQLGQVFINIIHNAVQAVLPGQGHIVLETRQAGDGIAFRCADNGPGIPSENLQNIFKPFYTTKQAGEGTGLGLYICHDIIERHQGKINVLSNPSDAPGTTFEILLPLKRPAASAA